MANSVGIIDAGYRGNIMAKIRCFDQNNATLSRGSYFQIVAPDLGPIKVNIVSELKDTSRNENGFGSTNSTHPFGLFV
jgi:dUTP pyrophosphatase